MIPENIKKLLDSDNEEDNLIGWELVNAQEVSFKDVNEYVQKTKIPTNWIIKYRWDGNKFVRNDKIISTYETAKKMSLEQMKYQQKFRSQLKDR